MSRMWRTNRDPIYKIGDLEKCEACNGTGRAGQQAGGGEDGGGVPGTGLSAAIDCTSAAGGCGLCKSTGVAYLPDPWGGVTGTCPDCNGTGGVLASNASDEDPHVMSALNAGVPRAAVEISWLLQEDMQDLQRFYETCEDSQPYDVPKDRMRRLVELGVIQWCGGARYSITAFGQHVLDLLPEGWPRLPLKTHADHDAYTNAQLDAACGVSGRAHEVSPPADADAPIPAEVGRRALEAMQMKQRVTLWENDGDAAKFRAAITELQQALEKTK